MTHPHSMPSADLRSSGQSLDRRRALTPVASALGGVDHLTLDGVSKSFPDRRVLTDVSCTVASGERACLIGENGTGKSTLLRIIAGLDDDHGGRVTVPGSVGLFHQQPPFALDLTVQEVLDEATAPVRAVAEQVARLAEALADSASPGTTPARAPGAHGTTAVRSDAAPTDTASPSEVATAYDRALAEAARTQAWDVDQQVDRLVDGLDLARIPRTRPASSLSGGQLSRLALAWLLLRRPDTLLLDEPTNHLDARGTALLVDLLAGWSGPVLIASHDRAFLDDVATTLLDLDPAPQLHRDVPGAADAGGTGSGFGLTRYGGRYTDYLLHRIGERERWERRYRDEQAELKRLRQQVKDNHTVGNADRPPPTEGKMAQKFYADRNAKVVSRRVNEAATALARLEESQVRRPPAVVSFGGLAAAAPSSDAVSGESSGDHLPTARGQGAGRPASDAGPVLAATEVALDGRLAPVSVHLGARSRLLITGPNGAGKSTLLRILAGDLTPDAGSVTTTGRLTIGLLGQDAEHLTEAERRAEDATVAESYRQAVGDATAQRVPLGTFGLIAGRDEHRRVRDLSVGQRRRLDLAVLLTDPPDVLLLDEPTNHFSLLLSTQLEASIPGYPGAVVVASHDRWLRAGWKGQTLDLAPADPAR
ncbi:ABC-F family ATP-binding cassette domain-containing protein [Citricoccus sp. K5]|uniref:ABC-F family ATP-binding cassette domain-containing protein n=1 Tax=Citricoccus sp. K5 TaxID=2653135 RepID=UPI0012F380DE|nr:ATP-binding cassette domain-containing protein [Citricoccus sp. K5]VXB99968.1 Macrolide transport system ATP-binding/permease protein [Citricoccus sp. K5]